MTPPGGSSGYTRSGMCERSWNGVVRINMRATHAILPWAGHEGRMLTTL